MKKKILYLFFLFAFVIITKSQTQIHLSSWKFRQASASKWHKAFVPGNVITDLFKNKLIEDPFYSDNEKNLQWIEKENWEYYTTLKCDKILLNNAHIELVFEGLDTYAKVYINDSLVLSADNMFRSWKVSAKKFLKEGDNSLKVVFESAVKKGKEEAAKLSYTLPERERIFTRKAQFQYGWDFGPRFATCGIWKPVKLVTWNEIKIESLHYKLESISDSIAKVDFILETNSDSNAICDFRIGESGANGIKIPPVRKGKTIYVKPGINRDTLSIVIYKPKLWWSNGLGDSYLYNYFAELIKDDKEKDRTSIKVGLRTIELVNEKDSLGKSFYFKLNGKSLFIKGANYIPSDIFLKPKTKVEYLKEIDLCKNVNMNMLRVWGGGVYGDDDFYNACDEKGILVWQDLMFACGMYPGDTNFISNVKAEVKEQVTRLRNHPSLALWCGNNENREGWYNWGWQKQFNYTQKDSMQIWKDYKKLFQEIIPNCIKENDDKSYWESSPSIGWGRKESLLSGDSHYWGVWWGIEPFSIYEKKAGRFMSEYGFQSMPALSTFKTFCNKEELNLNSKSVRAHQKHRTGYETIQAYLEKDYKTPKEFKDYIYVSQLLQRDGMKTAIEAHRTNKPYCMGTLFWQLNDCWPGASWSAIDYFQQPKAFYYALADLYKTQLISISQSATSYQIKCLSDSIKNFETTISVKLRNFKSESLWEKEEKIMLTNEKVSLFSIDKKEVPAFDTSSCYLKAELITPGKILTSTIYFFTKPKHLNFPKSTINIVKKNATTFEISSDFFAKDVYLYDENFEVHLDNNYFDLEAGEKKTIKLLDNKNKLNSIKLKAIVLNNL